VADPASDTPREPRFSLQLAGGLILLVATLSVVSLVNLGRLAAIARHTEGAMADRVQALLLAERVRGAVDQLVSAARGNLLAQELGFAQRVRESQADVDRLLHQLAARLRSAERVSLVQQMREASSGYRTVLDAIFVRKARGAGAPEISAMFEQDLVPRQSQLSALLDELVRREEWRFEDEQRRRAEARSRALLGAMGTLAFGVLASSGLAAFLGRHLAQRYQRERAAVRQASDAMAAREELMTIVAHDLRSPLHAIGLRATMLLKGSVEDGARRQAEAISGIVSRTSQLLGSLLDAAMIDSGRLQLEKVRCEVGPLLDGVVGVHGGLAAAKRVELEVNVSQPDLTVSGDSRRIAQVLDNLVGNAIRFSPPEGRVHIAAEPEGAMVHFQVKDSGPGISAAQLPHVFERYWRAQRQTGTGIGLGLYIARNVVEAHGGTIWAENQEGAVFHFTLPAGPRAISEPAALPLRSPLQSSASPVLSSSASRS
jgi:signal transduction histidine kinase